LKAGRVRSAAEADGQMMLCAEKSEMEERKLFLKLVIFLLIDLPERGFFAK